LQDALSNPLRSWRLGKPTLYQLSYVRVGRILGPARGWGEKGYGAEHTDRALS